MFVQPSFLPRLMSSAPQFRQVQNSLSPSVRSRVKRALEASSFSVGGRPLLDDMVDFYCMKCSNWLINFKATWRATHRRHIAFLNVVIRFHESKIPITLTLTFDGVAAGQSSLHNLSPTAINTIAKGYDANIYCNIATCCYQSNILHYCNILQ